MYSATFFDTHSKQIIEKVFDDISDIQHYFNLSDKEMIDWLKEEEMPKEGDLTIVKNVEYIPHKKGKPIYSEEEYLSILLGRE